MPAPSPLAFARNAFPIWAEENGSLGNNTEEWAFGNGANTPQHMGVTVPFDCTIEHLSLTIRRGVATVGVYVDGARVGDVSATGGLHPDTSTATAAVGRGTAELASIPVQAGQSISFRTITASNTSGPNVVCAWLAPA